MVADAGLGAALLDHEAKKKVGISGWHQFYQCCRGNGVFVSMYKNNNKIIHTNIICNIVQHRTKILENKNYWKVLQKVCTAYIFQEKNSEIVYNSCWRNPVIHDT